MDIFKHFPPELITLVKKDGRRFEKLRALVETGKIMTNDPKIPIEDGDEFVRTLPTGIMEHYIIIDAGFQQGFKNLIPPYYASIVRKSTAPLPPTPQQHFHLTGPNSRVNIGSHDASTNTVNHDTTTVFANIRSVVQQSGLDSDAMQDVVERLEKMQSAAGTKSFAQRYSEFIAAAANHATVMSALTPYLPALTQLLT